MNPSPPSPASGATARALGTRFGGAWDAQALGRSAFCATWRAQGRCGAAPGDALFVKTVPAASADMLQAEADGLAALAAAGAVRPPVVAGCWVDASLGLAVLALEWLELAPRPGPGFGERLGQGLAALHGRAPPEGGGRFGWPHDNWIGATPQTNRFSRAGGLDGWIEFVADQRLGTMAARLTGAEPVLAAAVARLIDALPGFFADGHVPRPSLEHGDLWSGNWGALPDGTPVVFDPAISVSDAEAELAMMELFGAPPPGFWPAYRKAAGLAEGYAWRRGLYQLYHLLNHALLFGGGYARQSMALVDALLRRHAPR